MSTAFDPAFVANALVTVVLVAGFILVAFIGASVALGLWKLRYRGGRNAARSLEELVGQAEFARYLPPDAPRGTTDQLRARNL